MERFPKSLISFQRMFPDEAACAAWLFSMRWPEGFQCPGCGHDHGWALRAKAHTFECTSCHRQTSVTAGTILHGSKLDLTVWFWAAYLMATHSNGISALQLQKQLALGSYRTAWMLAAKLRRAMVDPDRNPLSGLVEIDETSLPFRTKNDPASGGPGRSHDGKLLVVGGIEVGDGNKPGRLRLAALTDYGAGSLNAFIARNIAPASTAKTDGWAGYAGVPVDQHDPHVIGAMAAHLVLPWIHQMFSNLKGWARGVYHGLRRKYLQTYLDEFVFRFNRRRTRHPTFRSMFAIAIRTKPVTYNMLVAPEQSAQAVPPLSRHNPAEWYRRAAEQRHGGAQLNLGVLYSNGDGVPTDYIQALMWTSLAASQGVEGATAARNSVADQMTGEQVTAGERLARAWRPNQEVTTSTRGSRPTGHTGSRKRIGSIQRQLASLGYDPGPADGILGPRTRDAMRTFQAKEGLPATGAVSTVFEEALRSALAGRDTSAQDTSPFELVSSGSGFIVSNQGHVLTNDHVIAECRDVRIPLSRSAAVVARDAGSDLALLKIPPAEVGDVARFRQGRGIRSGDDVVVVGFPLRGLLASEANVTRGAVSALAGPKEDRRLFQLTAPVQPGNSGGPVLDASGNVVGVVMAKLNALQIARTTGDIPQNVNFAVSAGTVRSFLDTQSVPYHTAPSTVELRPADVAARAKTFTVGVECWK